MSENENAPPPLWGKDPLTGYIELAHRNRWATFVHETEIVSLLLRIDAWLEALRKGLINPKHEVPALLLLRAQLLYRNSCELALAGNLYASMPLQRASLEAAAYALRCAKDHEALKVWMERDDSKANKKAARSRFTHSKTKTVIAKSDAKLAEIFTSLYERTIDFGAHPNPSGIWTGAEVKPIGGDFELSQIGLHGPGPALDAAMRSSAQVGVFVIRIAELIWPERVELLQLSDEMWALRRAC